MGTLKIWEIFNYASHSKYAMDGGCWVYFCFYQDNLCSINFNKFKHSGTMLHSSIILDILLLKSIAVHSPYFDTQLSIINRSSWYILIDIINQLDWKAILNLQLILPMNLTLPLFKFLLYYIFYEGYHPGAYYMISCSHMYFNKERR